MDKHQWGRELACLGSRIQDDLGGYPGTWDTKLLKQLSLEQTSWKEGPGLPPWSPKLAESKAQLNFVAWRLLAGGNFESLKEALKGTPLPRIRAEQPS